MTYSYTCPFLGLLVEIPNFLYTVYIYVSLQSYYLFVNVGSYDDAFFLHHLQELQTFVIFLHFVMIFYNDGKNVSSSHRLLDIGLFQHF